jgi:hypothetical protein
MRAIFIVVVAASGVASADPAHVVVMTDGDPARRRRPRRSRLQAAYLRCHDLHDARTALASLELASTDLTPLGERGLALRVQILVELGRRADARTVATRYLQQFPKADLASFMRSLIR